MPMQSTLVPLLPSTYKAIITSLFKPVPSWGTSGAPTAQHPATAHWAVATPLRLMDTVYNFGNADSGSTHCEPHFGNNDATHHAS